MKITEDWRTHMLFVVIAVVLVSASAQQQQQADPNIRRSPNTKLFYSKECQDDIIRYCRKARNTELSDLAVLQCIYNEVPDLNAIDKECHNLLYGVKKNLTVNLKLDNSALQICKEDLAKIPECNSVDLEKNGHLLSCILDNKENITTENCRSFVTSVAALVFSDYRLISNFIEDCGTDIERYSCGRIEKDSESRATQQGKTIECLTLKYNDLTEQCRKQITRVVELQSDDFHLDRTLYFACRDDREKFCHNVLSGNGAVYKCLMKNKFNSLMSTECQEQLTRRQKIIVENAFADKTLIRACKKDLQVHKCRRELRDDQGVVKLSNSIKLSNVLLCLESAVRDGDKISPECEEELIEHRKILMSDYQLNPSLVKQCSRAIAQYCGNGIERGGKTLHCLMKKAKMAKMKDNSIVISSECFNELRELIKIADPSEDIRVDPGLQEACQNILTGVCRDVKPGQGRMIGCLLDQLNKGDMNEDCQERLLEVQFFVVRDWRLTPQLYQSCRDDAIKLCSAKPVWQDWSTDVDNGPLVLPCLFHHLSDENDDGDDENSRKDPEDFRDEKVSKKCESEIRKLMIKRAKSIDLMPEIQEACYTDLAKFCIDPSVNQKGEELRCLQMNFRRLEKDCVKAVKKYSETESKDVRLDQILMRACQPIMDEYCSDKKDGKGDLLECLISQKNNPKIDEKCRMGIEHHQLLNMQNVDFNYKFKRGCHQEINEHCANAKSKIEVVRCLSDIVLNDTLLDKPQRLNEMCREHLRFELLQLNENIKLDPELDSACQEDASNLCGDVKNGRGELLECLRSKQSQLTNACRTKLLARDRLNMIDQKSDYKLVSKCRDAIERYCDMNEQNVDLIGCLRKHLLRPNLELGCRKLVIDRIMEQNTDARLNPSLWTACNNDIKLGCHQEFVYAQDTNNPLNGRMLKCLKALFVENRLSKKCEVEVNQIMREAAFVDYRLDPMLAEACTKEVGILCFNEPNDKKEDCLRLAFQRGQIPKQSRCFDEVHRIIIEGAADIFTDHELSEVCAYDLNRYCSEIAPGGSQQLKCLLGIKKANRPLSGPCSEKLDSREQLWKTAHVSDSLTGFNDLARMINTSEHRSYLLVSFFFIIASVFVLGCFCRPVVFRNRRDKVK